MIGVYELREELGSGAMGKVYRARDTRLDREVALKVLWPHLAEQGTYVTRFEREARAAARIRHQNVVAVHDIGAADDYHYLAMEYISGPSLLQLLQQPLPVERALKYFKQILAGLGTAHELGIIHRDLKPGNILIDSTNDTVKLADFGLARFSGEELSLTQSGEMLGTIEYIAPEIARGETANRKTDLYAAGVVFYRMLTGRIPFTGASPSAVLRAHECGIYSRATEVNSGLPRQADLVISRLLACEPSNRYQNCQAALEDILRWERGEDIPEEFASSYQAIDHKITRYRLPAWKQAWYRIATWFRYQYLEAFNRTELTAIRIQDAVRQAEQNQGKSRRRLEEATLLANRLRARLGECRQAMQQCQEAAEQAVAVNDDEASKKCLAEKYDHKIRCDDIAKELAEAEQLVAVARKAVEKESAQAATLRNQADLLITRRRRAKLELSMLGVLPKSERRRGEQFIAAAKILTPIILIIAIVAVVTYFFSPANEPETPVVITPAPAPIIGDDPESPVVQEEPVISSDDPSMAAILESLYIYEPFEQEINAEEINFTPDYTAGKFGYCLSIPDQGRCSYQVWDEFLTEATVMAWVKPANIQKRIMFWQNDNYYPSAFFYPNHEYKLCMHFCYERAITPYGYLQNDMVKGEFYHLTQSWGPDGFKGYVNGQLLFHNTQQRTGVTENTSSGVPPTEHIFYLGNDYDSDMIGGNYDDFAIFTRQLTDSEIALLSHQSLNPDNNHAEETIIPGSGGWAELHSMPWARTSVATAVAGDMLYVIGGYGMASSPTHTVHGSTSNRPSTFSTVIAYDPQTNQWSEKKHLPQPRSGFAAVTVNGKIYAVGGGDGDNYNFDIVMYNPATDSWRSITTMPTRRDIPSVAAADGKIYVIGGKDYPAGNTMDLVEVYDIENDSWKTLPPLSVPRIRPAAVALDGKIYVIGGHNDNVSPRNYLKTAEVYDPDDGRWRPIASMSVPRTDITEAAAVLDDKIYVFSGWGGGSNVNNSVEMYDPDDDEWTEVGQMNIPRERVGVETIGDAIYVVGGSDANSRPFDVLERFIPD